MLLSFTVKNYRSIKDEQEISMVPSSIKDTEEALIFKNGDLYEKSFATSVMYGPNASGKTSLILALNTVKKIIKSSLVDGDLLSEIIMPFAFDQCTTTEPSEFNITFISNEIKYNYGFSTTKAQIFEEWLYHFPKGRANKLFTRIWNDGEYVYSYGQEFKGERKATQNITSKDSLYLSASLRTTAHETTENVLNWFLNILNIIGIDGIDDILTSGLIHENELSNEIVVSYLKNLDIDIHSIKIDASIFNELDIPSQIPENIRNALIEKLKGKTQLETNFIHQLDGNTYELPIDEESSGTKKLYGYAALFLRALSEQKILIVDELNNSLHSKVVKSILDTFSDSKINKYKSQLFFTTHDTSILSMGTLRRDQIWLCEKNKSLATEFSSLVEYKTRALSNYEDAYLSGKFNAVPITSKINARHLHSQNNLVVENDEK